MLDLTVQMPLAQVNTSLGGAGSQPGVEAAPGAAAPGAAAPGTAAPGAVAPVTVAPGAAPGVQATPTTAGATTLVSGTAPATGPATQPAARGLFDNMLLPIIMILVVLYFVMFRGPRKEEKKRKLMMSELKKGDRVMTIGGMIARVVSIDGDEVILKIDESANVKAAYRKSAIQEVLDRDEKK